MNKNHEIPSGEYDSSEESQWDDVERMGEERPFYQQEERTELRHETPEERATNIELAAQRVRDVFAKNKRAEGAASDELEVRADSPYVPRQNKWAARKSSRQAKRIDRLVNGDHRGIGHDVVKDRQKVIDLVEEGGVDLTNPTIADSYIQAKFAQQETVVLEDGHARAKTYVEKIDDMVGAGLPPEKPVMAFVERVVRDINTPSLPSRGKRGGLKTETQDELKMLDGEHLALMAEMLEKYDLPRMQDYFTRNINVQSFGHEMSYKVLQHGNDEKYSEARQEKLEEWQKSFSLLQKMGFKPFKDGVPFNLIFGYKNSDTYDRRQKLAESLSLISENRMQQLKCSFAKEMFDQGGTGRYSLIDHPELRITLPLLKQKYLDILDKAGDGAGIEDLSKEEIEEYFDEDGAKSELWQKVFLSGGLDGIIKYAEYLEQDKNSSGELVNQKRPEGKLDFTPFALDEKQVEALNIYHELNDYVSRETFRRFIKAENLSEIPIDRIKIAPQVISRLWKSNADEMRAGTYKLAKRLLGADLDDDDKMFEKIEQIENIYLHNNLPYVGKVYKTFRMLYPVGQIHKATPAMERGALAELPETGLRSKDTVMFNDLLKASMGSNNRDLRKYLEGLQAGDELARQVEAGREDFSDEELEVLKNYSTHLATIYSEMQAGKKTPEMTSGDVLADIRKFSGLMSPTDRYSVPDRLVRSFGFGLGIKSCEQMLIMMGQIVAEADRRNRETAAKGKFLLESGDLVKSTDVEYLGGILQNGSVCKEFLNGTTGTDFTPLDTDLNMLPGRLSGNVSEGVDWKNKIAAYGKTHCVIVLKGDKNSGRNRFAMEEDHEPYNPSKYEVWDNGDGNHGIRVGFPSTEIDYLIYDDLKESDHGDLERMKFEVVRNGFYIPIVDKVTGKLTFSPEEYDAMRENMAGLSYYEAGEYHFADQPRGEEPPLVPSLELGRFTVGDEVIPSTTELISQSEDNRREVDEKRGAILDQTILPVLAEFGLSYKPQLDGDLTEGVAECIDTGSTGRYSNAPGDGDFDFMMKLDYGDFSDGAKMEEIRASLEARMRAIPGATIEFPNGNIRAKGVRLEGLDKPVDIDITFSQKTNKVQYSTDMALRDYYSSMPEDKRKEVVANVVFAKKLLKAAGVYKGANSVPAEGGLGGVGVENWVLQNGGSFLLAAKRFMIVAESCSNFEEFRSRYTIWNFGENHKTDNEGVPEHNNFVEDNMDGKGFERMKRVLARFLASYE